MKLREVLNGLTIIESTADLDMDISGIGFDSRKSTPGELFVAVHGYKSDGHKYVDVALKNGSSCVLCEEKPDADIPYVLIDNTRKGLAKTSANFFENPAEKLKVIGVTGTNGKTTTTNLIKRIIEQSTGKKVGLIGTNNHLIGTEVVPTERTTPESYEIQELFHRMVRAGCEYVVMEVSSHALYLDRVYGIIFDVGIFMNLTRDHLDFHKTMDKYGKAKSKLFAQSRVSVINIDDEYSEMMINAAYDKVYTYSTSNSEADLVAKRIKLFQASVEFCALTIGKLQMIEIGIPGMFSVYNALAATAACVNLGMELEDIAKALRGGGVKGRAEIVPTGRSFEVIIDYAHTPDALENIIDTIKPITKGRVITLFGCGGDRDKSKRPIMGEIAAAKSDFVVITSDNPRTENPSEIIKDIMKGINGTETPHVVIENRREAIEWAINNALPDDMILLAGKGHETYQIIGTEKTDFDERNVVANFLAKLPPETAN